MSLDRDTVEKIAFLARITIPDDQLDGLAGELNTIVGWVEQLSEVNTDGVEPMTSVADMATPTRADTVNDGGYPDRVLANATEPKDQCFTVPKVVE